MSAAKNVAVATALAVVMFGMSGGAEASAAVPPPPPYDDVTEPQDFTEFWAAGPRPGVRDRVEPAVTPAEGRALCAHYQQWDAYGEVVDYVDSPTVGFFGQLWHGKDNVRNSDGSKPRSWWS